MKAVLGQHKPELLAGPSESTPMQRIQHRRRGSMNWDMSSEQGVREAFNEVSEANSDLTHTLGRINAQLEEKQDMWEQSVELGEKLQEENKRLRDELEQQKQDANE